MTEGFEIYNPDGSLAISSAMPMTFVMGSIETGAGTDGSFTIPDIGLTKYFAYITGVAQAPSNQGSYLSEIPEISLSGRDVKWKFNYLPSGVKPSYIITYGGYSI